MKFANLMSAVRNWVETHALGVGAAGLAALVVGGGIGVAALVGGDDVAVTESTTSLPAEAVTTTSVAEGESPATTTAEVVTGEGGSLIGVKIDNDAQARPQVGLQEASLVFEVPVEGGLTRFTAFYEAGSYPVVAGPVRSVRPVDADLFGPLSSVMVATGGQRFVIGALSGAGVNLATPETAPGFQALERPAPSNLFVDLSQVQSVYPPSTAAIEMLPVGSLPGGAEAASVTVPYASPVTWEFADGSYVRSQDGEPFLVLDDPFGEPSQLSADTVVVLFAAQKSAGYTDAAGADVPTFDVVGSGRLAVFHQGSVVEGTWIRSAQADPYRFFTDSGESFGLPSGVTHVAVVPRELDLDF
jgi:hypothetical protein